MPAPLEKVVEFVGQEVARRKDWILVEGKMGLLGDKTPQIVITPKGAEECPELLET
ncbi:hypothetical protein [Thiolapillus sp.]|uniref:hypothetical protein n=1 Tax=Thiolapillus sp. TaxID=2017437 RepID=UPI003AF7ADA2